MKNNFQQHIFTDFPELLQHSILLAVSGGIDSVVLMHLLHDLGIDFAVAHCNFHLRGEDSNEDQKFVEELATRLGKKCYVADFDTANYVLEHKVSIQIAARELRYEWFDKLMNEYGYTYLVTAHHLDDSMETFLINFSRGTGLEGLIGIPDRTQGVRRPLLPFTRDEIHAYAKENRIEWREDITNEQTKYLRNKIRKLVLPIFKEVNPSLGSSFIDMISHLKGSLSLSKDAASLQFEKVVKKQGEDLFFDIESLKQLSDTKAYLYQWLQPYGFTAWNDIFALLDSESGKMIKSADYILLKDRTSLILRSAAVNNDNSSLVYYLDNDEGIRFPVDLSMCKVEEVEEVEEVINNSCIYVDADKLVFPLEIRKVRAGDVFKPFGMKGTKKVSKFFKDEKFSQFKKDDTWILCSENKIAWVIGSRMSEDFKVTKTTINILKLQIN